jgi:hypothetical protein
LDRFDDAQLLDLRDVQTADKLERAFRFCLIQYDTTIMKPPVIPQPGRRSLTSRTAVTEVLPSVSA